MDDDGDDVVSARLVRRVRRDFPDAEEARGVVGALRGLAVELADSRQSAERLMAAVLLVAQGDVRGVRSAVLLGRTDWRDLLVAGGLAIKGWPEVLEAELGKP
ncbi:hypothetical protein ACGFZR_29225 [Streptomyces sp. NPDC048241]|uniref:hypothetical protein n=1 Tax=Streptomyces sp. NPDC048241 TaxID=3365521 RepID=UPI003713C54D